MMCDGGYANLMIVNLLNKLQLNDHANLNHILVINAIGSWMEFSNLEMENAPSSWVVH